MGNYQIDEVIERWGKGELTSEQAIGQGLLHIQELTGRVGSLEQRFETWRLEISQRPLPEKPPAPKKRRRRRADS
jgi:hypothetical protein